MIGGKNGRRQRIPGGIHAECGPGRPAPRSAALARSLNGRSGSVWRTACASGGLSDRARHIRLRGQVGEQAVLFIRETRPGTAWSSRHSRTRRGYSRA